MLACEESTSMLWARVVRGAASSAKAVRPAVARRCRPAASKGLSMPMTTVPGFMSAVSAFAGRAHLEHHVGPEGGRHVGDFGAGRLVGGIGDAGCNAGPRLHANRVPGGDQFLHRLGRNGHTGFAGRRLGRHAYQHRDLLRARAIRNAGRAYSKITSATVALIRAPVSPLDDRRHCTCSYINASGGNDCAQPRARHGRSDAAQPKCTLFCNCR